MLLWMSFALLAAAVASLLMRQQALDSTAKHDPGLAVYRDQLDEIVRDADRGLIDSQEASSARIEIARRLLAENAAAAPNPELAKPRLSAEASRRILVACAALIPVVSMAVYLAVGSPTLPSRPLADRLAETPDVAAPDDMIAKVEARLREKPEDGQGWAVIAPVYLAQGRAAEAATAFARAIALVGENPDRLTGLAKANIIANNGIVNASARDAFTRVLELDGTRIEPKFWLAVYDEQNGRPDVAAATYVALLAGAPADAPWRTSVERRLSDLTKKQTPQTGPSVAIAAPSPPLGSQATKITPPTLAPALDPKPDAGGPTPAQFVAAAQKLPAEMREQMIGRMVAKANDGVKLNPKDLSAWSRAVTGYAALGKTEEASTTLRNAQAALSSDQAALAELAALSASLGLPSQTQ